MAVYTRLELTELAETLTPLELGHLVTAEGVSAGIENTTYFLTFAKSGSEQFVLTIAETISWSELQFIAAFTTRLSNDGAPVPCPAATRSGESVLSIHGKPGLVVPRARGSHPIHPSIAQCYEIGRALAQCHCSAQRAGFDHPGHRNLEWVKTTGQRLLHFLDADERKLMNQELMRLDSFVQTHRQLPTAVIHGDLFRDNALFAGDELTAIIDFFSAGNGYLMFDLAVTANDWCLSDSLIDQTERLHSLLAGYAGLRTPTPLEQRLWPDVLAIAALRFWVSRLADRWLTDSRSAAHRIDKDPNDYRTLLLLHRNTPCPWRP